MGRLTSPQEYIQAKQDEFLRLLESSHKAKKIDDLNYKRLLLETCEYENPDDIYDYFHNLFDDLQNCLENAELFILEARIVKGAEMIEKETDPKKLKQYNRLYDALIAEHEALKEGRHEQKTAV